MNAPTRPALLRRPSPRTLTAGWALVLLCGLPGCGTPTAPVADPAALRAFAARGYAPLAHDEVGSTELAWTLGGKTLHLLLTRPQRAATLPLILYLPGLGETREAGAQWRQTWAAAGYAVLALQPLEEDAAAYRSPLARSGDFRALGQERYGAEAMSERVQVLAEVLAQAQRRGAAGEAVWQGIAWDRVAVAGYDLGAYTAMVLAGEAVRGASGTQGRIAVKAAIAISPYASVAEGALATRYGGISGAVLSVTSDSDGDALGLVGTPALRYAPYEQMPGPAKALLALQGLPHARLGGNGGGADAAPRAPEREAAADEDSGRRGSGGGNGGGNGGGSGGGNGGRHRQGNADTTPPSRPRQAGADGVPAGGLSPTALQLRLIAAQDVSTAFLDAYVKDDVLAREWLAGHAAGWLGALGELRLK